MKFNKKLIYDIDIMITNSDLRTFPRRGDYFIAKVKHFESVLEAGLDGTLRSKMLQDRRS